MRAIITVVGKDTVGILAEVSQICSKEHVNIMDVTQSIMQDMFVMIMMVDISSCAVPFSTLQDELEAAGSEMNLKIHVMHEDIFNSMHRI
ncbi:MAG: ACT domain-containing protein [Clostridia bacterium]|nr:ACT domain-containing protein [Clostridia bacterium]MDD7483393.1 ACT domain-containing protein [Clostridia bacterium]MDY5559578.1 ACT domain-containing protein [Candidatus Heritagella sp.]